MAIRDHSETLKQGIAVWNDWRTEHPEVAPDLREADLRGLNLDTANLSDVNLSRANLGSMTLRRVDLRGADLCGANLIRSILTESDLTKSDLTKANLTEADLSGANLREAILTEANLSGANLRGANLFGTTLSRTDLSRARLSGANFGGASMGWTILGNVDLSQVIGLEDVYHWVPSVIGIDTVYRSQSRIPEVFLKGAGVPELFTTYMASLVGQPIQLYSCFLSHASIDGPFAERLRSDLLANNVSCWHYRYDMRGGQFWRVQINEAIKVHDKLVLICSKASLQQRNVVDEIVAAMERERETGSQKLFPIRLDDFVLADEMLKLADGQMASGQWREDWVRYVRAYHIPNFGKWKRDHDAYREEFQKLLEALKDPARR